MLNGNVSELGNAATTDLLILGGGMAASQLIKRLGHYGFAGSVVLVSDENVPGYNRVLLPHYVGAQVSAHELSETALNDDCSLALTRRLGVSARKLDVERRRIILSDDSVVVFQRAVFALGSHVIPPAGIPAQLPGVMNLRNWADADALQTSIADGGPILFIGGGLLGLEAADAVASRGCPVTLIQRGTRLLSRQVDRRAAALLVQRLRAKGVEILLQEEVAAVKAMPAGLQVSFKSARPMPRYFTAVVVATGCSPRVELAETAGIPVARGVTVNNALASPVTDFFALGECAEVSGTNYQLVEPINEQADVLAQNLCGGAAVFAGSVEASHLKVEDVPLFFAGAVPGEVGLEDAIIKDSGDQIYRRLCIEGGVLRGAVLFGDTLGAREIQKHINLALSPTQIKDLVFGQRAA